MTTRWRTRAVVIAAVCIAHASHLTAWGDEGHRITARIAWNGLQPKARVSVAALLRGEDFVEAATWADRIRIDRPNTRAWHFVDIPFEASSYQRERDCRPTPSGDCAIDAFARSRAMMLNQELPNSRRAEALKFLIHIVGDLHQPFHAIDRGDQGGNALRVFLRGKTTSLHAAWDNDFIRQLDNGSRDAYAEQLYTRYGVKAATFLGSDEAIRWALEAHELGRQAYAYQGATSMSAQHGSFGGRQGPAGGNAIAIELSPNYVVTSTAVVEEQLARAGVRLAALLNEILR